MFSKLSNLKISQKIVMLTGGLAALIAVILLINVGAKFGDYRESVKLERFAEVTQVIFDMVHSIQLERGVSATFFFDQSDAVKATLDGHRKKSAELKTELFDKARRDNIVLSEEFKTLLEGFARLRADIDTRQYPLPETTKRYGDMIQQVLYYVNNTLTEIAKGTRNANLLLEAQSLGTFALSKETTGQERAFVILQTSQHSHIV